MTRLVTMRWILFAIFACVLIGYISASGIIASGDPGLFWPRVYRDNRLTGRSPVNGPLDNTIKWTSDLGAHARTWPVIGNDGIIITGCEGVFTAVKTTDGQKAWTYKTGLPPSKFCAVADDGTVYAAAGTKLYALSGKGELKWSYDIGSVADSPSIGPDGTIYTGSLGGRLVALSCDGKLKWQFQINDFIHSPSFGSDGTLYVGAAPLVLFAMDSNGKKLWESHPEGKKKSYPDLYPWLNCLHPPSVGDDGTLYSGSQVSHNINSKGQKLADYDMPSHGKLYAISASGEKKWEFSSGSYSTMTPTISSDGTLYAGTTCWEVIALSPSGKVLWRFNTGEKTTCPFVFSPPIGKDGFLYASTSSGKIFCITPDGKEKWRFSAKQHSIGYYSNNFSPAAIGADGTLYATLYEGKIYAFK